MSSETLNVRGADTVESGRQHGAHSHGEEHAGPAQPELHARRDTIHTETELSLNPLAAFLPSRGGKATAVTR